MRKTGRFMPLFSHNRRLYQQNDRALLEKVSPICCIDMRARL